MLRNFYYLILVLFLNVSQSNATVQEQFLEANLAYKNSDFKKALSLYQALENKGAAVWYNMGNCWYNVGTYSKALVCWKKALKYGGAQWHERIEHNCQRAYEKLGIAVSPSSFSMLCSRINRYSLFMWQLLFLVLLSLFCGLAMHLYGKKPLFILVVPFCLIGMSGVCLAIKYQAASQIQAIVHHECPVVAGTDERFSKIGTLITGQEVRVKSEKDRWCKIESNDHMGWTLMENIEYI